MEEKVWSRCPLLLFGNFCLMQQIFLNFSLTFVFLAVNIQSNSKRCRYWRNFRILNKGHSGRSSQNKTSSKYFDDIWIFYEFYFSLEMLSMSSWACRDWLLCKEMHENIPFVLWYRKWLSELLHWNLSILLWQTSQHQAQKEAWNINRLWNLLWKDGQV